MRTPQEKLDAAIPGGLGKPKDKAGLKYMVMSPLRNEKKASVAITFKPNGDALLFDYGKGPTEDTLSAWGLEMSDLYAINTTPKKNNRPTWDIFKDGQCVSEDTYQWEDGTEEYVKMRYEPNPGHPLHGVKGEKKFLFKHRDPDHPKAKSDGYVWNLEGCARLLFNLPEVKRARGAGGIILVVEGEKDVHTASDKYGYAATTPPTGADSWDAELHPPFLMGAHVVVVPDNDATGRSHAKAVAASLIGVAASVKLLEPLGAEPKYDLSDFYEDGGTLEELEAIIDSTPVLTDPTSLDDDEAEKEAEESTASGSIAARLLKLVEASGAVLCHDAEGRCYITIRDGEIQQTFRLESKETREWLAYRFWRAEKRGVTAQARDEALSVLGGKACWDGKERVIAVRVAEIESDAGPVVYIDLGDDSWSVIEVRAGTWSVIPATACPILFVRRAGSQPLPMPVDEGTEVLARFAQLISLAPNDSGFRLLVFFCLQALRGRGPYPILQVTGEQGSGKSTAVEFIRNLIDPNTAALRSIPASDRNAYIACSNSHVQAFDNVSGMNAATSDRLCRISTGGAMATRSIYTDDAETLFNVCSPIIINGINSIAERADLAERCVTVRFCHISPDKRKYKSEMDAAFEEMRPALLGALLTGMASGLERLPTTTLQRIPRLADFARYCVASEEALGFESGSFFKAFDGSRRELIESTIEGDEVAELIVALLKNKPFAGTASELYTELESQAEYGPDKRRPRTWPKTPSALKRHFNRLAPILREVGISIEEKRDTKTRTIRIYMEDTGEQERDTINAKEKAVHAAQAVREGEKPTQQPPINASGASGNANGSEEVNGFEKTLNGLETQKPLGENRLIGTENGNVNGVNGLNGIPETTSLARIHESSGDGASITAEPGEWDAYPADGGGL